MADAKHTPGPWQTVRTKTAKEPRWHIACPTHVIADTAGDNEANARLIAAAPDLLAELKALSRAYVSLMEAGRDRIVMLGGDCDPVDKMEGDDPALRSARAVIAKATGAA